MTNQIDPKLFPSIRDYNQALTQQYAKESNLPFGDQAPNVTMKSHMFDDLDLNNGVDCIRLFHRVRQHFKLEDDRRPKFTEWAREKKEELKDATTIKDFENLFPSYMLEGETLEGLLSKLEKLNIAMCSEAFWKAYPKEEYVSITPVGKLLKDTYDSFSDELKSLIYKASMEVMESLCQNLELVYGATVALQKSGEPLWILRDQINWTEIFRMREELEDLCWYLYHFENENCFYEVLSPYQKDDSLPFEEKEGTAEFMVNNILHILTKAYNLTLSNYTNHTLTCQMRWWHHQSYEPDINSFILTEEELNSSEEQEISLSQTTYYKNFCQRHGELENLPHI